jgi:3-ketosteroid 9alpha-monooxygenase subunit B
LAIYSTGLRNQKISHDNVILIACLCCQVSGEPNRAPVSTTPGPRFVPLRVVEVIDETHDARSYVFNIPEDERDAFAYRAGQYCTFKAEVDGITQLRCYSMSSSPDVDEPFRTTVKRVIDGVVSNHINNSLVAGDTILATPPAGVFCLDDDDNRPIVAFAGGSGITPIASITKTALAATDRSVQLLFANRDAASVILGPELDALAEAAADRFTVSHHHDDVGGFLTADEVANFLGDDLNVAVYICGPTPFMDLVEQTLRDLGHDPELLRTERFVNSATTEPDEPPSTDDEPGSITLTLSGRVHELEHHAGETILEAARRGGLNPPFSCQAGNCATCIAELREGDVRMRVNDVLTPDELAEGWILTCQSLPTSSTVSVVYPD